MPSPNLTDFIEQYHHGVAAFVAGNPELQKSQWSRRDDVTLANPLGPPARGWIAVEMALDQATTQLRAYPSEAIGVERIVDYATADLAYTVEIERDRMDVNGTEATVSLRVTTIFRREDDAWRIVHRHADTITTARSIVSLADSPTTSP